MVFPWGARSPVAGGQAATSKASEAPERTAVAMDLRARYRGAMLGLAVGDALGTTLEFAQQGEYAPVFDLVGGGPHGLEPGQFTDDTSMALCLADSLLACRGFDPEDQLRRYVAWWREGERSSTGRCFDIGNTTAQALRTFLGSPRPFCGSEDPETAGNGSIMRLAPVPLYFRQDPRAALHHAADSSRTTHGARAAVDSCRYLCALMLGALGGDDKERLLAQRYEPWPGLWREAPLCPEVDAVAAGDYRSMRPPGIDGGGYVVASLRSALWAFMHGADYLGGLYLAVNLGNDADTTGAVYGQLAGAYYGESAIPQDWRRSVGRWADIAQVADDLLDAASR